MTAAKATVGLCESCGCGLLRPTARGTSYWRCLRSKFDPSFARYPRLPVLACRGFEPADKQEARRV
jgi:hypothetical protein